MPTNPGHTAPSNTPLSPTDPADTRTQEFARLFDYFEYLASRRYRGQDSRSPRVEGPHPPLIANIAPALQRLEFGPSATVRRADHIREVVENRLLIQGSSSKTAAEFPLKDRYTFTFKLMIHKLYDVREFVDMVRGVVEKSRTEFKSLAEQDPREETDGEKASNRTRNPTAIVESENGTISSIRTRRHSTIGTVESEKHPVFVAKGQVSVTRDGEWQADIRVVKKRCIEREKVEMPSSPGIMSPTTTEWTYKATGSLVERNNLKRHGEERKEKTRSRDMSPGLLDGPSRFKDEGNPVINTRKHWSCDGTSFGGFGRGSAAWQWQPLSPTLGLRTTNRGNQRALNLADDGKDMRNDRTFATKKRSFVE